MVVTALAVGAGIQVVGSVLGGVTGRRASRSKARARRRQIRARIDQLVDQNTQEQEQFRRLGGRQRAAFGAAGVRTRAGGTAGAVQVRTVADALLSQERIIKGIRALQADITDIEKARDIELDSILIQAVLSGASATVGGISGTPSLIPQSNLPAGAGGFEPANQAGGSGFA